MCGQHEPTAEADDFRVSGQVVGFSHDLRIASHERQVFVALAELEEESAHDFLLAAGALDEFERGGGSEFSGLRALEDAAFEGAATDRAFRIDAAEISLQRGTRLRKADDFSPPLQRKAERSQAHRVVAFLEPHIGEDDSVAAQATCRTQLAHSGSGICGQSLGRTFV